MPQVSSRFAVAVVVVLSLVVAVRPAAACRCLPPSVATGARAADVVFVGTIERVDVDDHAIATVTVRAVWKGAVAAAVTVHDSPTSCRKGLTAGDTLVFMARHRGRRAARDPAARRLALPDAVVRPGTTDVALRPTSPVRGRRSA